MSVVEMAKALVEAARDAPSVVDALQHLFQSQREGADLTPAMRHLEAVSAAHYLKIDEKGL